jgi:hypothetical protein
MSLEEIVSKVDDIGARVVEITGGEPLVHRNAFVLAERLLDGATRSWWRPPAPWTSRPSMPGSTRSWT